MARVSADLTSLTFDELSESTNLPVMTITRDKPDFSKNKTGVTETF